MYKLVFAKFGLKEKELVEGDVVGLAGEGAIGELLFVAKANGSGVDGFEETIVVAFAVAEAVPFVIKGKAWNEDVGDLGRREEATGFGVGFVEIKGTPLEFSKIVDRVEGKGFAFYFGKGESFFVGEVFV